MSKQDHGLNIKKLAAHAMNAVGDFSGMIQASMDHATAVLKAAGVSDAVIRDALADFADGAAATKALVSKAQSL